MQKIILIGFMGSGKTSIAKKISEYLDITFIDTDAYIEENQNQSINEIFTNNGEEFFRALETKILEEIIKEKNSGVIATGGGLPIRDENQKLLKGIGKIVYLRTKAETIYQRIKDDNSRPLLNTPDPRQKIHDLLNERTPIYEKTADVVVDTDNKSVGQIVDEILFDLKLIS